MAEGEGFSKRKRRGTDALDLAVSSRAVMMQQFGKLPPSAIDLEEAVLGAILLEKGAIDEVIGVLPEEAFYKDANQKIYAACKTLYNKLEPIDILTVTIELRRTSMLDIIGGAFYITQLTNRVASAANIQFHLRIVLQKYAQREIIRLAGEAIRDAFEDESDVFTLIEKVDNDVQKVREALVGKMEMMSFDDQVREVTNKIEVMYRSPIKVSGIPTGNPKLDSITGGWQKTDLIIMAGRPASGKSTRALNCIKSACVNGKRAAMFSLEMSWEQIVRKFINEESEVYVKKLVTGDISNIELDKIMSSAARLMKMNFYLNDKPAITPSYIRSVLKQQQKRGIFDLVVVDYTQIMQPNEHLKGRSRDSELGTISGALKSIAKEFNVPVIILAQLSRKCEERLDKRPILSDLRESGCVSGDTLIYNPVLNKTIAIRDLVGKRGFSVLSTDFEINTFPPSSLKRLTEITAKKCFSSGNKTVYELKLSCGRSIKATSNHKFITLEGWKPLGDITIRDSVAISNALKKTVGFSDVSSISTVGIEEVFDIEVPEMHNFVANGIIAHNSLEADADLVIGLYRPSYYYALEKDNDYKGEVAASGLTEEEYARISELLILKHRNGEIGRIKEKFYGEFSRFEPEKSATPLISSYAPEPDSARMINANPNTNADKFITSGRESEDVVFGSPDSDVPTILSSSDKDDLPF